MQELAVQIFRKYEWVAEFVNGHGIQFKRERRIKSI